MNEPDSESKRKRVGNLSCDHCKDINREPNCKCEHCVILRNKIRKDYCVKKKPLRDILIFCDYTYRAYMEFDDKDFLQWKSFYVI